MKKSDSLVVGSMHDRLSADSLMRIKGYLAPNTHTSWEAFSNCIISCFCPCYTLGKVSSMIHREEYEKNTPEWECAKMMRCYLGPYGFASCLKTAFFCVIGWPLSPLLVLYTCNQRDVFRRGYDLTNNSLNKHVNENGPVGWEQHSELTLQCFSWNSPISASCCCFSPNCYRYTCFSLCFEYDLFLSCCLWPFAVQEHVVYINKRRELGLLPFPWEYDLLKDPSNFPSPPPSVTSTVMIIGPAGCGKTSLFQKVIRTTDKGMQQRVVGTVHDEKTRIGTCAVSVNTKKIVFIEAWDLSYSEVMRSTPTHVLLQTMPDPTNVVLLTFDCIDAASWSALLHAYDHVESYLPDKLVLLVALKYDLIMEEMESIDTSFLQCGYENEIESADIGDEDEGLLKETPIISSNRFPSKPILRRRDAEFASRDAPSPHASSKASLSTSLLPDAGVDRIEEGDSINIDDLKEDQEVVNVANEHPLLAVYYEACVWAHKRRIHVCNVSNLENYGVKDLMGRIEYHALLSHSTKR